MSVVPFSEVSNVDDDVVRILEEALERAKKGEFRNVLIISTEAYITEKPDERVIFTSYEGYDVNNLVTGAEWAKMRILSETGGIELGGTYLDN